MPAFDLGARTSGDMDWALLQNGYVHLFWRSQVLDETVNWLRSHNYQIIGADAAGWAEPIDMLSNLGKTLQFPDYYGRNLDALNDCLRDVAFYEFAARTDSAGTVLVMAHFDTFARRHRQAAQALLDIYAGVARIGMLAGHRMLCLVQSDDPAVEFDPVGASRVMWNPREWQRAKRMA